MHIQKGQSLIELIVAVGFAVVILSFIVTSIVRGMSLAVQTERASQASSYAKQGIEVLHQMRDRSWTSFNSFSGNYCMVNTCTTLTSSAGSCGPTGATCNTSFGTVASGQFRRHVALLRNATSCGSTALQPITRATVTVTWNDNTCLSGAFCRAVTQVSCLGNVNNFGL